MRKIRAWHSQRSFCAGKKALGHFSFSSFNKQKIEHQPESNSGKILDPLTHGKPPSAPPRQTQAQEVSALRKTACHFFSQAGFKPTCINLKTQQVSNMHHTWLPYPPTKNIIQHSPWAG
jgi:hypothetical protein